MSRRIITTQLQTSGTGSTLDTYFDKVLKYIPADVNGAWVAATGIINGTTGAQNKILLWVAFLVGLAVTAAWTYRQTSEPGKPPARTQTLIATGAFFVWVLALGGPFATIEGFNFSVIGALALIGYTLLVGLVTPNE
jgi:hypothetical protein